MGLKDRPLESGQGGEIGGEGGAAKCLRPGPTYTLNPKAKRNCVNDIRQGLVKAAGV